MHLLQIGLGLIILLALASAAAVGSYGRFAEEARGPTQMALPLGRTTRLDRLVEPEVAARPGESGLLLVENDLEAFALRAQSALDAGRSLDLQYYYWRDDLAGRLLVERILAAADRGVRVRLLLDDINVNGDDGRFRALDRHPSIEVRLFNPSRNRDGVFRRGVELLLRAYSANRRMHNKMWIADGRIAVVGGRNIGDAYFAASRDANFRDVDLMLLGPLVQATEQLFDQFWNSDTVLPIAALSDADSEDDAGSDLAALRSKLGRFIASEAVQPYRETVAQTDLARRMDSLRLHWTERAELVADPPEKGRGEGEPEWLIHHIVRSLRTAERDILVISPYLVPGENGMSLIREFVDRGVELTILTNSLAATDVAAVHGGYAPYRVPMLEAGVALFELKPEAGRQRFSVFGSTAASLHTKAFAVDDVTGFVGSFNFDPRSVSLNTEMGVLFTDPDLTRDLRRIASGKLAPEISYRVRLVDGSLVWEDAAIDPPRLFDQEPGAGFWRRAVALAMQFLPIESQL